LLLLLLHLWLLLDLLLLLHLLLLLLLLRLILNLGVVLLIHGGTDKALRFNDRSEKNNNLLKKF